MRRDEKKRAYALCARISGIECACRREGRIPCEAIETELMNIDDGNPTLPDGWGEFGHPPMRVINPK